MKKRVDKVVVLWTANTEMFMLPEVADIADLESKVERNIAMASSVLFCMACIEE